MIRRGLCGGVATLALCVSCIDLLEIRTDGDRAPSAPASGGARVTGSGGAGASVTPAGGATDAGGIRSASTDSGTDGADRGTTDAARADAGGSGTLLDATPDAPRGSGDAGSCLADDIELKGVSPHCENEAAEGEPCPQASTCREMEDGFRFEYDICNGSSYASCEVLPKTDMTRFDAGYGRGSFLQATFCVEAVSRGPVNLWYGQHPLRKYLPLVPANETLQPGCYLRHFAPSDAKYADWCEIPESCKVECPGDDCHRQFRERVEAWTRGQIAVDLECYERRGQQPPELQSYTRIAAGFDLKTSRIELVAEWCSAATQGAFSLRSVRLLTPGCACSNDDPCDAGPRARCHFLQRDSCGATAGVCGPAVVGCSGAPGPNQACKVYVGGTEYQGRTECVGDRYVCTLAQL